MFYVILRTESTTTGIQFCTTDCWNIFDKRKLGGYGRAGDGIFDRVLCRYSAALLSKGIQKCCCGGCCLLWSMMLVSLFLGCNRAKCCLLVNFSGCLLFAGHATPRLRNFAVLNHSFAPKESRSAMMLLLKLSRTSRFFGSKERASR